MLDTNICIYIIKQKPVSVFEKFEQLDVGSVGMSIVTYAELYYGAEKSKNSAKTKKILDELSNLIPPLPMPINTAVHYGKIRASLEKKGKPIGNNDLWIASHSKAADLVLVTNNLKEFDRVSGLKLENWVST